MKQTEIETQMRKFFIYISLIFCPMITYASSLSISCTADISTIPEGREDLLCKQPVPLSVEDITEERAIEIAKQALILNNKVPEWFSNSIIRVEFRNFSEDGKHWDITFLKEGVEHRELSEFSDRPVCVMITNKGRVSYIYRW